MRNSKGTYGNIPQIKKSPGVKEAYEFGNDILVYFDNLTDARFFLTGVCSDKTFKLEQINVMLQFSRKERKNECLPRNNGMRNKTPKRD